DFDIVSPPIGACYTKKALDEFGMVFGKIQKPTHGWCLENSFMGFHRGHETFLFEQLIPDSVAAIANDQKNCFWAFRRAVKEKFSEGEQKYLIVPVAQMAGPNSVGICDKVPLPKPDMGVPDDRKASQQPPWFKNSFWGAFFSGG
ncbi:MAG TPA: hypothetical protein PKW15_07535, partial [Alphaproteobacteria bacterium]|nr:hypothetical protein [Alphaproteobacteria bacterium]